MSTFIFTLTNGLVIGAIYALSALGVSLVAGLMRVVNCAHGEFYIFGAYASYVYTNYLNLPVGGSVLLAAGTAFAFGLLIEKTLIRSSYGDSTRALILTFVLSIVLQNLALLTIGPFPKKSAQFVDGVVHLWGGSDFGAQRLISGIVAIVVFILFYLLIQTTRFGKNIRAAAQDPEMAEALGISVLRIRQISFAIAVTLAAIAGIILSPIFPVTPTAGESITLASFVIIVIGGMGSVRGCLLGGLVLGITENFGSTYLSSIYSQLFGFLFLVIMLLFKPMGFYGNKL